jgi:hypothetical protein
MPLFHEARRICIVPRSPGFQHTLPYVIYDLLNQGSWLSIHSFFRLSKLDHRQTSPACIIDLKFKVCSFTVLRCRSSKNQGNMASLTLLILLSTDSPLKLHRFSISAPVACACISCISFLLFHSDA